MLVFVKEIPVVFGPHWADEWLVWVTVGSVVTSGVLGWLAYWNGRKAGNIASQAAAREEKRLSDEAHLRRAAERRDVAVSLAQLLEAFVVWAETAPGTGSPAELPAKVEIRRLKVVAYSKLTMSGLSDAEELQQWLNRHLANIAKLAGEPKDRLTEIDQIAAVARKQLAEWNSGVWTPVSAPRT